MTQRFTTLYYTTKNVCQVRHTIQKCMPGTSYHNIILTVGASGHPRHVSQSGFATDDGQLVPRALAAMSFRKLWSECRAPRSTATSWTAIAVAIRHWSLLYVVFAVWDFRRDGDATYAYRVRYQYCNTSIFDCRSYSLLTRDASGASSRSNTINRD